MKFQVLIILGLIIQGLCQEQTSLNLDFELKFDLKDDQLNKFFKLNIPKKESNRDVVIHVQKLDFQSDPDVAISLNEQFPSSQNATINCATWGSEICVVPADQIKDVNTDIFINVNCQQVCSFQILAQYNEELAFTVDFSQTNKNFYSIDYQMDFAEKSSQIIKLKIPQDQKMDKIDILASSSYWNTTEPLEIYANVNKNKIPTSDVYDMKGSSLWLGGQAILLDAENKMLCSGCFIYVLIHSTLNTSVKFMVRGRTNDVKDIQINTQIMEQVNAFHKLTYRLKISKELYPDISQYDIVFNLQIFSGNPEVFINPDSKPESNNQYLWKIISNGNAQELVLTPQDRQKFTDTEFYILIVSSIQSCFDFSFSENSHNDIYQMYPGLAHQGSVANQTIDHFYIYLFGQKQANVTLTCNNIKGHSSLFIKSCDEQNLKNAESCQINLKEIQDKQSLSSLFLYNEDKKNQIIEFKHEPKSHKTLYSIAVYGNSAITQYNVQLDTVKTQIKSLVEAKSTDVYINHQTQKFLKFELPDDTGVDNVQFQISVISGQIKLYMSKSAQYPSINNYDRKAYFFNGNSKIIFSKRLLGPSNGHLNGTYYIGILGQSSALINMLVLVHRQDQRLARVELISGQPQTINFFNNNKTFEFQYQNIMPKSNQNYIQFEVEALRGQFEFYVSSSDQQEYNEANSIKVTNGSLVFDFQSDLFIQDQTYYISVKPLPYTDDQKFGNQEMSFTVQCDTSQSIETVQLGLTLKESIFKQKRYRVVLTDNQKTGIELYLYPRSNYYFDKTELRMFIKQNELPTDYNFTYTLAQNSILKLSPAQLQTMCPQIFVPAISMISSQCNIYLMIQTNQQSKFSLLVKPFDQPIVALEGIPLNAMMPIDTIDTTKIIYEIVTDKELTISATSQIHEFELYANIISSDAQNFQSIDSWNFPNSSNHSYSSQFHGYSYLGSKSIQITNQEAQKQCSSSQCYVLLAIQRKNNQTYEWIQDKSVKVQIYTKEIEIELEKPMIGYLLQDQFTYFDLILDLNPSQINKTLWISVEPISEGDPDLYVLIDDQQKVTKDNADYRSSKYNKGEELEISLKSLIKSQENQFNQRISIGTQINFNSKGVYGKQNCTFNIVAYFGDFTILGAYPGSPQDISLQENQPIFVKYINNNDQSLRFIFSVDFGTFESYVNKVSSNSQLTVKDLPSKDNQIWYNKNAAQTSNNFIFINSRDPQFCSGCQYIIGIYPSQQSKLTFVGTSENQGIILQSGKNLRDNVKKSQKNTYSFEKFISKYNKQNTTQIVVLNIVVFAGEITVYLKSGKSVNETDYGIKKQNKDSNVMHIRMKLESQNDYYYYGQMSVMVVGNSLAYYQINAHSENLPVIAKDQRVYLSIGNDIIQNVTFFHSNSNETQQILINYNNNQFKNKQIDQKTLNSLYPQIQVSEQIQEPQLFNRTDMQILTLNGLKEQQKYTIQILNKNLYENLDLQIQLLQPGLKTLLPFIDQYDTALVGQSNDYEMFHSQQESNLLLEVFHCVGRTQLFARESLEGEFDLKERLLKANHLIGVYRVSTTPVYITVKATEGFKDEQQRSQSSYILKSHVLSPNMKIPFELYNPGDNSRITWSNNQDKSVSIKFQSIQCQDTVDCILSNEDEIIEYEYQTWITDTWDEINSLSNCQMDLNQLKQLQTGISQMEDRKKIPYNVLTIKPEDNSKDIEIKIQGLQNQNDNPLYATVVGTLKVQNRNTHKIDQFTYIYNDIEFYQRFENINHDSSNFWVYVLALILITALIIGFKYFQQYKAVQNRLNYEMSDVRNVGQIRMDEF